MGGLENLLKINNCGGGGNKWIFQVTTSDSVIQYSKSN